MRAPRRALLVGCALLAAHCGGAAPESGFLPADAEVVLSVTVAERVTLGAQTPSKRITINVRGHASPTGEAMTGAIESVQLEYVGGDGVAMSIDTQDRLPATGRAADEVARRRLAGQLVDAAVEATWLDERSRCVIEGPGRGLMSARERARNEKGANAAALDAATAGLAPLLDDARLSAELTAAGLVVRPAGVADPLIEHTREVPVVIPGKRIARVRVSGRAGQQLDGAAVVRMGGSGALQTSFEGDPGSEPPDVIGPVVEAEVSATAETLYGIERGLPQRGNIRVNAPHARGPLVERSVEFSLVVIE